MNQESDCKKCSRKKKIEITEAPGDYVIFDCATCGNFRISRMDIPTIEGVPSGARVKIAAWIRDQERYGKPVLLTDALIRSIGARPIPSLSERADRLLSFVIRRVSRLGESFTLVYSVLGAVSVSN